MTNEEAIAILRNQHRWTGEPEKINEVRAENEALEMAIEALKAEPCEDAVSREALLKAFCDNCILAIADEPCANKTNCEEYRNLVEIIETLPPVTSKPTECEDAVSRQAVLDGLASIAKAKARSDAQKALMGRVMFFTEHLPPVTPKQRTGKWIKQKIGYGCSNCTLCTNDYGVGMYKFCPNCGAKMEGVSE